MKYLRAVGLAICLVLAFTLGTLWRSQKTRAQQVVRAAPQATTSSLVLSCASAPPGSSLGASFICVGDLDGTGISKVLLADWQNNGTNGGTGYWKVAVKGLSDGYNYWFATWSW
jgi:hypothetical protein